MSSDANLSSCTNPFQPCLDWIVLNSPPVPTSPESPIHYPTQPGNIRQEPESVVPMRNLALSISSIQPVPKSNDEQSDAWRAFGTTLKALETGVGMFPPLQTAVSGLLECTTHIHDTRLKELNPVHDARYNAALPMEMQRRGCTPNTRVKILQDLMNWTQGPEVAKIYWMSGMAGTGKTTIAYSLCQQLEESKQLGACFFCSRASLDCKNVNKIVPTIAYQLAQFSNPYRRELCKMLSNNPDVARRELSIQLEKLIVGPLLEIKDAIPTDVIIVIDALDECSDTQGTQKVLELLSRQVAALPVKFFVTSRPEPGISSVFSSRDAYHHILYLHEVEDSLVQADIHTYLEHELIDKAKPAEIERLTVRAGRLFIFAATVVRYIEPYNHSADHAERLMTMLGTHMDSDGMAYRELDELYSVILSQALLNAKGNNREMELRRLVLQTVIGAREPLTIPALTELIDLQNAEAVQRALLPLQSVLRVSADAKVVTALHASFPDFMLSVERSGRFYCDMSKQNTYMASRCFEIMQKSLKFNICNLETSWCLDQDVSGLQARADEAISPGLFYAARYWGDHLDGANHSDELAGMLVEFLQYRLLYWMEVLNLKDGIGYAAAVLLQAFNSLPAEDGLNELRIKIQDSRNFVTSYAASPAAQSTPHIYVSMLPLVSEQSFVRKTYRPHLKGFVVEGTSIKDRGDAALATWATGSSVTKLALSRDGKRIVHRVGYQQRETLIGPLKKHNDDVWSVAFSPDGSRIASGSRDCNIYISNSYSGATLVGPLTGHTDSISFLSFSPDGAYLASASEDHTIRIWNSITGAQFGNELRGHQNCVMCVVFSSGGKYLVSSSDDHTIQVWDWRAGNTIGGPFKGHTDWVDCIALSPDDAHIVSGSRDCTVRVWNVEQGKTVVGPLAGHSDRVKSVAFSPDGKQIVSGSFDQTIRVWSSSNGDLIAGPFRGHGDSVYSVLFSHDGTQIISGSEDGTICVWDANHSISGTNTALSGHTGAIISVALSPNGTRILSGSTDRTIRVWDTQDGTLVLGPLEGHTGSVWSVAYTPDGACLVSGSEDSTIRTWDANTGLALADPFAPHTGGVTAIAVSPDGNLIVSGSLTGSINTWRLHDSTESQCFPICHTSPIRSVDFSPNGSYIASVSGDATFCLWDTDAGSLIRRFEQHASWAGSAKFSSDGQKLVACSDNGISIWDVNTGALLSGPWKGHVIQCWADFSSNVDMIVSGAADGAVHLWDAKDGRILTTPFRGHSELVYMVASTLDNKRVVSCSIDRTIRFWNLDNIGNMQKQAAGDWETHDDGWVKDSESRLVLWLPPDLKHIIPFPPCSLAIHPEGSAQADFSNFIYGDRWWDCYREPSGTGMSNI
ncbi:WD40-repeat-containing domain protein [Rhizoctonia solani]|nr:WD40-repeat-containing domain protein [Rhizoctonia solani]